MPPTFACKYARLARQPYPSEGATRNALSVSALCTRREFSTQVRLLQYWQRDIIRVLAAVGHGPGILEPTLRVFN